MVRKHLFYTGKIQYNAPPNIHSTKKTTNRATAITDSVDTDVYSQDAFGAHEMSDSCSSTASKPSSAKGSLTTFYNHTSSLDVTTTGFNGHGKKSVYDNVNTEEEPRCLLSGCGGDVPLT